MSITSPVVCNLYACVQVLTAVDAQLMKFDRFVNAQTGQDVMQPATTRQLLGISDAAALDYRCREPIAPSNANYCATLLRKLERCRRQFGRFTLRCNNRGATACSTSLAEIQRGRCSAL